MSGITQWLRIPDCLGTLRISLTGHLNSRRYLLILEASQAVLLNGHHLVWKGVWKSLRFYSLPQVNKVKLKIHSKKFVESFSHYKSMIYLQFMINLMIKLETYLKDVTSFTSWFQGVGLHAHDQPHPHPNSTPLSHTLRGKTHIWAHLTFYHFSYDWAKADFPSIW